MPRMIIPGFTLRHARTVASCASSSVKSHVSSNKATPRKSRVVPMLLTSRFSCCNLDWGFRFGHISSIFHSMATRTRRRTDFVGWESSTTQLKNPSEMLKTLPLVLPIPLSVSPRVQGSKSGSQGGVQFLESTGDRPPGPRLSAALHF